MRVGEGREAQLRNRWVLIIYMLHTNSSRPCGRRQLFESQTVLSQLDHRYTDVEYLTVLSDRLCRIPYAGSSALPA
jgi:hypothetical protein